MFSFEQSRSANNDLIAHYMNRPKTTLASRRVLYIGGVEADASMLRDALAEPRPVPFELEWVDNLADGLRRLASAEISVILMDLGLLHGRDVGHLGKVEEAAPRTPILLVGSDADVARRAGHSSSYCLLKSRLDGYWLRGHSTRPSSDG